MSYPLLITAYTLCFDGAYLAQSPEPLVLSGFAHPESLLLAPSEAYVSNIGEKLDPLAKDGDGFISLLDRQGNILNLRSFTGLDAPKGMAIIGDRLFVADIDRILGFDLQTYAQVFVAEMNSMQPLLLNDLAAMGDQLLVSETMEGKLYALNPQTGEFEMLAAGIAGANGITWDAERAEAIIVGMGADFTGGQSYNWSAQTGLRALERGPSGLLDGVALVSNQRILVSDWIKLTPQKGRLLEFNLQSGDLQVVGFKIDMRGPADFTFDPIDQSIWLPATLVGRVMKLVH